MNDVATKSIFAVLAMGITFTLGSCVGATSVQKTWQLNAAKTDCAQFNPEHGMFEWTVDDQG